MATQESLRAQIGMVTQDTSLLHRSVRDNIVYGRPDATDARDGRRGASAPRRTTSSPAWPIRRAGARYDAHVGERGVKLSGGQRQRDRDRARDAEGRADPAARRGDERARFARSRRRSSKASIG